MYILCSLNIGIFSIGKCSVQWLTVSTEHSVSAKTLSVGDGQSIQSINFMRSDHYYRIPLRVKNDKME